MTPEMVMTIGQKAIQITMLLAAPLLVVSLVIGLFVSIIQAATQMNDMTLSFVPKLLAIFLTLVVAGHWMIELMVDYMHQIFVDIPKYIN